MKISASYVAIAAILALSACKKTSTKSVDMNTTTEVYIDVDGARTEPTAGSTYGSEAVWSDYRMVSHDGGATKDSTGNFTLTANGGITSGGETGQLGAATDYDGVNDWVDIGNSVTDLNSSYTQSAWLEMGVDGFPPLYASINSSFTGIGYYMSIIRNDSYGACMQLDPGAAGASLLPNGSNTVSVADGITHAALQRDGNVYKFYNYFSLTVFQKNQQEHHLASQLQSHHT